MGITFEQLTIIADYLMEIDLLKMPEFLKLVASESEVVKKDASLSAFIASVGEDECPIRKLQSQHADCRDQDSQWLPLFNMLLAAMVAKKQLSDFITLCKNMSLELSHIHSISLAGKAAYHEYITPIFQKTLIQPTGESKTASYHVESSDSGISGHIFYYWGAHIKKSSAIVVSSCIDDKRRILPASVDATNLQIEDIEAKHLYTVFTFEEKNGALLSGAIPVSLLEQDDQALNQALYSGFLTLEVTNQIFSLLGVQVLVNKVGSNFAQ